MVQFSETLNKGLALGLETGFEVGGHLSTCGLRLASACELLTFNVVSGFEIGDRSEYCLQLGKQVLRIPRNVR